MPESPRWLLASGAREQARRVLARIGGEAYAADESAEIERTLARGAGGGTSELKALLEPRVRAILLVGVALAVLQQWSGINSIFNYAEEIYRTAGYGIGDIMFNIVITGAINLVFTLVAIAMVDRVGRRTLMLVGCAGIGVSHVLLGAAYAAGLQGAAGPRVHALLARRLRAVAGAGDLGAHRRDLPEPHPRRRRVGGRLGALDRLLHPDVHVPAAAALGRHRRHVLDLRGHLLRAGSSSCARRCPRPRAGASSRSSRNLGCSRHRPSRSSAGPGAAAGTSPSST